MKSPTTYYQNSFPISPEIDPDRLQLPSAVEEIGKINFEGNVIPHQWYRRLTLPSGKPDLPAITILAEIIYWYRPMESLDSNGKPIRFRRFYGHMFQSSAAYYENKFGLTKDQVRKALKRLEDGGYIRREYHDVIRNNMKANNVMFVEPLPQKIMAITHPAGGAPPTTPPSPSDTPPSSPDDTPLSPGDTLSPPGDTPLPPGETYTKISTKTTTTTTTTDAAENETTQTNEKGGSSSSKKENLIFDGPLAKFTQVQHNRVLQILAGLSPDVGQQVLDEFNSALTTGSIKKSKWTWLGCLAKRAKEGTFTPTADLDECRQQQAQTASAAEQPERQPSSVWTAHRNELQGGMTPQQFSTYIAAIRGTEQNGVPWLEAPNHFVAEWVQKHLPAIERTLRAHTPLAVRVCIG